MRENNIGDSLLSDRRAIARELVGYWSGIMVGGAK